MTANERRASGPDPERAAGATADLDVVTEVRGLRRDPFEAIKPIDAAEAGNRLVVVEEAITLTPAQVAMVAMWSVEGPEMAPVSVFASAPSFVDSWVDGDVLVTQGDAYVQVSRTGGVKEAVPGISATLAGATADFSFVRKGATVAARISAEFAAELAAYGAGDEERRLGDELLREARGGGERRYMAIVVLPAPAERARDPNARAGLQIPELDEGGDLFMIALKEIEPLDSPADA